MEEQELGGRGTSVECFWYMLFKSPFGYASGDAEWGWRSEERCKCVSHWHACGIWTVPPRKMTWAAGGLQHSSCRYKGAKREMLWWVTGRQVKKVSKFALKYQLCLYLLFCGRWLYPGHECEKPPGPLSRGWSLGGDSEQPNSFWHGMSWVPCSLSRTFPTCLLSQLIGSFIHSFITKSQKNPLCKDHTLDFKSCQILLNGYLDLIYRWGNWE